MSLSQETGIFTAELHSGWRRKALLRAGCSFVLALLFLALHVQTTALWSLVLCIVFTVFSIIPFILVFRCTPPLEITPGYITLRAIRQRRLSFCDVDCIVCDVTTRALGVSLISGEVVAVPWQLLNDVPAVLQALQTTGLQVKR